MTKSICIIYCLQKCVIVLVDSCWIDGKSLGNMGFEYGGCPYSKFGCKGTIDTISYWQNHIQIKRSVISLQVFHPLSNPRSPLLSDQMFFLLIPRAQTLFLQDRSVLHAICINHRVLWLLRAPHGDGCVMIN